ncbi:SET domain-containing protein SmydA-8 isoform X2 [Anoplolepis gracilipes]|uniref:SET domain-containing protein SmydA-8 isoform X2 n=1 Tax=Anoplolepis gracilipes TaxID=354296 RepID=UPI003BA2ED87
MELRETIELLESHLRENNLAQDKPRSWAIECSPLGGRGIFATRDIQAGELIYTDVPLLIGPRCYNKYLAMCVVCYKSNCPLFPCDHGCGLPICSTECENSITHSQECRLLREWMPTCGSTWSKDLMLALVPIRGLTLSKEQRKLLHIFKYHSNLIHNSEIDLVKRNVNNLPSEEQMELMRHICEVCNTNSFAVVVARNEDCTSLRSVYPLGAMQNHCCVPNTRHHFDDQQRLHEFGSQLGALFCAKDDCSGHLLPRNPLNFESPWICDKCQNSVKHRQIEWIRSRLNELVFETMYKTPREILKFIETVLSELVPMTNYIMISVKYRIISYFGRVPELKWEDLTDAELRIKKMYCNDILSILDTLGSGDSIKKGFVLYELYRTNLELSKRQISEKQTHPRIKDIDNKCLLRQAMDILQNDVGATYIRKSD